MNHTRNARTRKLLVFVMAACTATLLNACSTIHPAQPTGIATAPLPPVPNSSITIPIRINVATLSHELDSHLSAERRENGILRPNYQFPLNASNANPRCGLQIGVFRNANSVVSTNSGCLDISVPIAVDDQPASDPFSRVDCDATILLAHPHAHGNIHASANISGHGCLSVESDWRLRATFTPTFTWIQPPVVDVNIPFPIGNQHFDIRSKVDPFLNQKLPELSSRLTDAVSQLPTRTLLEKAWDESQNPIQISQNPPMTLKIEPISVGIDRLTSAGAELIAQPTIVAKVSAIVGSGTQPTQPIPLSPNTGTLGQDGFNLSVRIDAPYMELNRLAQLQLAGKSFEIGEGQTVTLDRVNISGFGNKVLIRADFRAKLHWYPFNDLSGWLYLTGKPEYDDTTRNLSFTDIEFETNTNSLLLNVAASLAHNSFRQKFATSMKFNLSNTVDPIRARIESGAQNLRVANGVAFNAVVTSFNFSNIHVGADGIGIFSTARGSANIEVVPQ